MGYQDDKVAAAEPKPAVHEDRPLNMTTISAALPTAAAVEVVHDPVLDDPKEDIQGWLDDVLDM